MMYLQLEQLKTILNLGRTVEQWIGSKTENDYTVLQWLTIEKENDGGFNVVYMECFDEGNEDFIDVYEFSTIDPDDPFGIIHTFPTIDEALEFSISEYHASIGKFVNHGMIQEEYLTYLTEFK